jgi:uncharacterized protein
MHLTDNQNTQINELARNLELRTGWYKKARVQLKSKGSARIGGFTINAGRSSSGGWSSSRSSGGFSGGGGRSGGGGSSGSW